MENIRFGIKQNLHFSTYGKGTITLKNPEFSYNGIILTVDGEVGFEDFDKIIHNEVFNFDADFTKPLVGGSILIVSKPVSLKCGLSPHICADIFEDIDYNEETIRAIILEYIKTEEEFLITENWSAFTLSQRKGEKLIGHETIWNTIDYSNPDLLENWEAITGQAAVPFVSNNEKLFNKIKEEQGGEDDALDFKEFQQFQNFLSDEDNPLSEMLSKLTGDGVDMENVLGDMSNLLSSFGEEGEMIEDESIGIAEIVSDYLNFEGLEYSYDEENSRFAVKFDIEEKTYDGEIIQHQDYYLMVMVKYPQLVNINRDAFLYRFMNVVNSEDLVGKIYFDEEKKSIFVKTNLILTFDVDESERIIDTIDANLDVCRQIFPALQSLINGTIDLETALEQYRVYRISDEFGEFGDEDIDEDFDLF